jgi:hypothetical protein
MGWRDRYLTKDTLTTTEVPAKASSKSKSSTDKKYQWNDEYRARQSVIVKQTYANDSTLKQRIGDSVKEARRKDPTIVERIGQAHLGRKASAETCAKISAVHKGKTVSEETRAKLRARPKQVVSEETRAKLREAGKKAWATTRKGYVVSEEARAKMSQAKKGRRRPLNVTGKPIMTPNGIFPSVMQVSRVAGVSYDRVHYWMKKWPQHYYYIKDSK